MEEKRTEAPGFQIHHQGVMDNGMTEISYRTPDGLEMRVYGYSGTKKPDKKKKGLFSRLFSRKKK